MKLDERTSKAPKTATAKAPPIWRLVLNAPLAVPAKCPGTLFKRTDVIGGATNGPAKPTNTITAAIHLTGVEIGKNAMQVNPADMDTRPIAIRALGLKRCIIRELNGVSTKPVNIIGKKATPVSAADKPRCCCRYRLMTNGNPK